MKKIPILLSAVCLSINMAYAATVSVDVVNVENQPIGQVTFTDTQYGLLITPQLTNLPPGGLGFHFHEHSDCGDKAMNAGSHFDPKKTNTHQGPYGEGHLGDLPVLYVNEDGTANTKTLAPRLKTDDIKALSLMVHKGGDNYTDTPKLGGGGDRLACGVVK